MTRRAKPVDARAEPWASILAALLRCPGATRVRVATETGITYGRAARALDALATVELVNRHGRGGRGDPYWYIRGDYPTIQQSDA